MPAPFLRISGVSKAFAGVQALADVDVDIERGTVHALVGENGAGKSTLGKILAGIHTQDSGTITVDGSTIDFDSPRAALDHGFTIVAQELALVGPRTVVENVFLGAEAHRGPLVLRGKLLSAFSQLVADTGIDVPATAIVDDLSIADQQKIEILRAIARKSDVIVMDEPTARLATHEAHALRGIVHKLRDRGTTIVYVSHFLDEVLDVADRITVLRDGKVVTTVPAAGQTTESLVEAMIGRTLDSAFPDKVPSRDGGSVVLQVDELTRRGAFEDISFEVNSGEIVTITGLVGSGRSEVVRSIFGAENYDSGRVRLNGADASGRHPRDAIAQRMAFIPESRKSDGLHVDSSIEDNVTLPHLGRFATWGAINRRAAREAAEAELVAVGVKAGSFQLPVSSLSGGNQQKVMFAKALLGDPVLLIADEPTRGVDVGAKRQIYDLLVKLAETGLGILLVSSEMEEVIGLSHRVVVMRQGRITGELSGTDITEQRIAHLAFGHTDAGVPAGVDERNHR